MPSLKPTAADAVLVTGASSGLGLETAVHLATRGFRVFAGVRDPAGAQQLQAEAARRNARVELLAVDVTDAASVEAAVSTVVQRAGGIYAVVNNAGIQLRGYFEDCSEAEVRQVIETNLFGAMALSRAVLPHMRAARRGRILLMSSIGGRIGSFALSAYCASKYAIEGFGESLALEVAPLGIQVVLIEPPTVRTDIWTRNRNVAPGARNPASPYFRWFEKSERMVDRLVASSPIRPPHVAAAVCRALTGERPRLRYLVGRRAAAFLALRNILPFEIFERVYFAQVLRYLTRGTN